MIYSLFDQVIAARHDRRNSLQLKHFNRSNANITAKPMREIRSRDSDGVSTISDYDWTLPTSLKQVQECLVNFGATNLILWPYDHTHLSLTRLLNRYDWCVTAGTDANRAKLVRALFNRVMETNAYQAAD